MNKIFVSSDLHLGHNREFIYKPRGFSSIEEMNEAIIERFNSVVSPEDELWLLGDLMLGDNEVGLSYLSRLNGRIHVVYGNHDTDTRKNLYEQLPNVVATHNYADVIHYKKHHFLLCHFPMATANLEAESLKQCTLNLFGHTHSKDKFFNDIPMQYNIAVDAHDCYPCEINDILTDMYDKVEECKKYFQLNKPKRIDGDIYAVLTEEKIKFQKINNN